ncbi:MAG: hypothetical protein H0V51_11900 [Chloroflexi bacterium]|nr:hypothetical protein [Chloroflexota bacterium]
MGLDATRAAGFNGALIAALALGVAGLGNEPPRVSAQQPSVEKLTVSDERGNQGPPRVNGKWVVFEDDRRRDSGGSPLDVRSWSAEAKEERRLSETREARHPAVSGERAVWAEPTDSRGLDIVVYDLDDREIERRVERTGDQDFPAISGRRVVWQEGSSGSINLFGYDLNERETFKVADDSGDQTRPAIDGDLVAFEDSRDTSIRFRDLKSERLQKIEGVTGFEPAVSGSRIAFRSGGSREDPENANIYVYDRSTNTLSDGLATTLDGRRGGPRIAQNLVVWWDSRDGDRDIYGYDLARNVEFRITGDSGDQDGPDVHGDLVVWTDHRGGDRDVRGARVTLAQPTPTPTATPTSPPATVGPTPTPPGDRARRDDRFFQQSGFRIDNDDFWRYFQLRGGVKNFGYPASRTFRFMGFTTQFFQRQIMQLGPEGPRLMNLLDPGLMPYTQINTSTFPSFDESLVREAPRVGSPNYDTQIVQFVQTHAPDTFNGAAVAFYSTFGNQVDLSTAFPSGSPNVALLPLINLELAGSVTSRPTVDPRNGGFMYQRFQRVILHFDASCGCTQPILLGDWFKSIITGQGIPSDLAAQAGGSPFYLQYNNNSANGLNRASALPDTDMRFAFEQQ